MEQFPINPNASSNVKWAKFDPFSETCCIDFKNAAGEYQSTYEYGTRGGRDQPDCNPGRHFTRQDWEDFRASTKPGLFFAERIRGKFPYRKISKPKEPEAPAAEQASLF